MSLKKRLLIACSCLALGVALQFALQLHLSSGVAAPFPKLKKPLSALPQKLSEIEFTEGEKGTVWIGKDNPHQDHLRKELPFVADDLLSRYYMQPETGVILNLYMVHSRSGEDRKHHPEICIGDVMGAEEDVTSRQLIFLDRHKKRAVQRFRFRTARHEWTTVYYWHYTFQPTETEGRSGLQKLHDMLSRQAPSITVQVSTTASANQLELVEKSFLVAIDTHLQQQHLPAGTRIGYNRLPVLLISE